MKKKQNNQIVVKLSDELKNEFTEKCQSVEMMLSSRIKYLIKMDILGKIKIKENYIN